MDKLKLYRKEAGLTQLEMGELLGISESGYCLIENGKRRLTYDMAVKIATILKMNPSDIFMPVSFAVCKEFSCNQTEIDLSPVLA